jgi:hypothetical protein
LRIRVHLCLSERREEDLPKAIPRAWLAPSTRRPGSISLAALRRPSTCTTASFHRQSWSLSCRRPETLPLENYDMSKSLAWPVQIRNDAPLRLASIAACEDRLGKRVSVLPPASGSFVRMPLPAVVAHPKAYRFRQSHQPLLATHIAEACNLPGPGADG